MPLSLAAWPSRLKPRRAGITIIAAIGAPATAAAVHRVVAGARRVVAGARRAAARVRTVRAEAGTGGTWAAIPAHGVRMAVTDTVRRAAHPAVRRVGTSATVPVVARVAVAAVVGPRPAQSSLRVLLSRMPCRLPRRWLRLSRARVLPSLRRATRLRPTAAPRFIRLPMATASC